MENEQKNSKNKWMEALWNFLRGIPIGIANIIPGVSGGTIGVMLGIYDKLIGAISNIRKQFVKSIKYLVPILLGAGIGVVAFNYLLQDVLLKYYSMQTTTLFMGLVVGSLPVVLRNAQIKKVTWGAAVPFAVTLVGMVCISVFLGGGDGGSYVGFTLNAGNGIMLVLCGIIAAVSMILPGISGSMMLMSMGYYYIVTGALKDFNFVVLGLFGVGVLIGLLGGAKVIDICIKHFRVSTYAAIIGLVVGSLYQLYLESNFTLDINGIFAVITFIIGAAIAMVSGSEWLSKKVKSHSDNK